MILKDISAQDRALREARRQALRDGNLPDFAAGAAPALEADWRVGTGLVAGVGTAEFLPHVQSASEAGAWAERLLDRERGAGDGVVLWVDSVWGAFEIEGIVYELRDYIADVCCDEDGFLLSFIDTFQLSPEFVLPDRDDMNEATHFLRSFRRLVESTCARRGVAFGGARSAEGGADEVPIEAADLLLVPRGRITERGMRRNTRTALAYLSRGGDTADREEAALRARSAARLAAAQLWQWVRHETGVLDVGRIVTPALFGSLLKEVLEEMNDGAGLDSAAEALSATVLSESFTMHAFCETATATGSVKR